MIFIYAPEIYPTEVRSTGLSMAYMASRIGGVAATQIIVLQDKFPWLPYTIFGIATGTAGLGSGQRFCDIVLKSYSILW